MKKDRKLQPRYSRPARNVRRSSSGEGLSSLSPIVKGGAAAAGTPVEDEGTRLEGIEELRHLQMSTNLYSVLNNPRDTSKDRWITKLEADQPPPSSLTERINTRPPGITQVDYRDVASFFERHEHGFQAFKSAEAHRQHQYNNNNNSSKLGTSFVLGLSDEMKDGAGVHGHGKEKGLKPEHPLEGLMNLSPGPRTPQDKRSLEEDLVRCFDAVPPTFFDPTFNLRDPGTFEKSLLAPGPQQENQEQLTSYLDLVEVALFNQIQARSSHFFRGLSDLQTLRQDVAQACGTVLELRRQMHHMQNEVVEKALKVPVLVQRQTNTSLLQEQLDLIQHLLSVRAAVPALLTGEDYLGALEVTQSAKTLLKSQLKDVTALRPSAWQFDEYEQLIGDCLGSQFINFAVHLGEESTEMDNLECNDGEHELKISKETQENLVPVISGLIRIGKMQEVLESYKKRLGDDLRVIVKTVVLNYLNATEDEPEESPDTIVGLRGMESLAFLMCLETCYDQIKGILAKASSVNIFLQGILNQMEQPGSDNSNQAKCNGEEAELLKDKNAQISSKLTLSSEDKELMSTLSSQCLHSFGENVQRTISQLLQIRQEVHCRIKLEELKQLWDLSIEFLKHAEKVTGSKGYTLKSTLLGQAMAFAEFSHSAQTNQLVTTLDAEKWNQAEVSQERQQALDKLFSGRAYLPAGKTKASVVGTSPQLQNGKANGKDCAAVSVVAKKEVVLEGSSHKVVWSCLLLIEMILSLLEFSSCFPSLTSTIIKHIVELLRLFNSRATQLVLGAGAIHSTAKLKSISAKHLALASQSLSLVRAITPHVRAVLAARLPPKQQLLLVEIDKAAQDFLEHHEKILAKFVSIIEELVQASSASLEVLDWDTMGSESCEFLVSVMKGTSTMHKVLHQQLPPSQLQEVFTRIFELLNQRIPDFFKDIEPSSQAGKQRIIDEVSHVVISLSKLKGIDSGNLTLDKEFRGRYGVS